MFILHYAHLHMIPTSIQNLKTICGKLGELLNPPAGQTDGLMVRQTDRQTEIHYGTLTYEVVIQYLNIEFFPQHIFIKEHCKK